jgi:prepilin-type N-terminal cleavage/methylation domain-containing protein
MCENGDRTVLVSGNERGFSLTELLISMTILMVVSGVTIKGVMDMSRLGNTVSNRSDMHAGVRNATELLSQEVGQAGRITLPAPVTLSVATGLNETNTTVSSTTGMFTGQLLTFDAGANQETARIGGIAGNVVTLTTGLTKTHAALVPVAALGGFAAGVVPDDMVNGSGPFVLKIFGDVVGDGNMVYVEYVCDLANRRLYRNMMAFTAGAKAPLTVDKVLIDNIIQNPGGMACFRYQRKSAGGLTYIVDVAITLTVESQLRDPTTNQFQTESKALLNVSPRNVFNVWQLAGMGVTNRVQPIPPTVQALLPN